MTEAELINDKNSVVEYIIVSKAGASEYSATASALLLQYVAGIPDS